MLSGGFAAGATSDSREASALVEAKLLFASGQWDLASQRLERVMHRDDFEEGDADNAEIFYLWVILNWFQYHGFNVYFSNGYMNLCIFVQL